MKIKYSIIFLVVFLFSSIVYAEELTDCSYSIFFNNISINNREFKMIGDSIYVPLRLYSNFIGYNVIWNGEEKSVLISKYQYPEYKAIEVDGEYGYRDKNGNIIIEPQFKHGWDFAEGMALVQNNDDTFSYINQNGDIVIKNIYPYTYEFKDGITIVIDYYMGIPEHNNNRTSSEVEYRTYYIDKAGNMLFGQYFLQAGEFHDGFAYVQIEGNISPTPYTKNVYTYINTAGEYATDMKFDWAGDFENGTAEVIKDGIRGSINTNFDFTPN